MGFIQYFPIGDKQPRDLLTTNSPEKQLWQEIVMIRHLKNPKGINAKIATASWLDQAKVYFLDAHNSDWRSAGLLYYYSFLNLAKAYLVAKKAMTVGALKSSNIYHGLHAEPQTPNQVTDFEIKVHPSVTNNRINIFASFYEKLVNKPWPHNRIITIKVEDILPYCIEINTETENFYNISLNAIYAQSLLRAVGNSMWLELVVPTNKVAVVQSNINTVTFTTHSPNAMNNIDEKDWFDSYKRSGLSFRNSTFLRSQLFAFNTQNQNAVMKRLFKTMNTAFAGHILAVPVNRGDNSWWNLIPKITLANSSMYWHPLLSDYLMGFVLSTILRYHPHLFPPESKESFLAEAWCAQSAITSLRYFLMSLTTPPLRFN